MIFTANDYAERFNAKWGVPQTRPTFGESFDANNDLVLSECGTIVYHRDGHITRGTIYSVTSDALIDYNRRHMTKTAFAYHYGDDDVSEMNMLLGANG